MIYTDAPLYKIHFYHYLIKIVSMAKKAKKKPLPMQTKQKEIQILSTIQMKN